MKNIHSSLSAASQKMKLSERLFFLFILLTGVVFFFVHFIYYRHSIPASNLDEASFFSPAYSMATKGKLSSDIHATFLEGASRYTYWMPPLHFFLLSGFLKSFGATVFVAKLFSFLIMLVAAWVISFVSNDRWIKNLVVGLFLLCPFIIISSAYIRMEALAILLIACSILAVKTHRSPFWTGVLAALGAMTHPLVLPCALALALYNLRKGIKPFLQFSIFALLALTPYLIYIFQDFTIFQSQMAAQMARKAGRGLSTVKIEYILQSVPTGVLALYLLFRSRLDKELRIFLVTGLLLSLLIIIRSNEFNYHIYSIPYVLATLGICIEERPGNNFYRLVIPSIILLLFLFFDYSKLAKYKYRDDGPYHQLTHFLDQNRSWEGKNIYVTGDPDVSIYFLMHGQNVERQNAVAAIERVGWFTKFNYVVSLVENDMQINKHLDYPWAHWKRTSQFTTTDGSYTLYIYRPE